MIQRSFNVFTVNLPIRRSFQWRVLVVLVALYFFANIAGIPLLRKTNLPVESVWFWGVATMIATLVMVLSLVMANRIGLGVPMLEGWLLKEDFPNWIRSGLLLTVLILIVGFPISLLANLDVDPTAYPFGWELLGASFKAGVVEEIVYRFFMVSLFVWLGRFFQRDAQGRPTPGVYWSAILIAGLLFGWGHVDAQLTNPAATFEGLALIMLLSAGLGIYFGWLFWKLGLEWAMFAHFIYDAFISMVIIPVYLLKRPIAWLVLFVVLVVILVISLRFLTQQQDS